MRTRKTLRPYLKNNGRLRGKSLSRRDKDFFLAKFLLLNNNRNRAKVRFLGHFLTGVKKIPQSGPKTGPNIVCARKQAWGVIHETAVIENWVDKRSKAKNRPNHSSKERKKTVENAFAR